MLNIYNNNIKIQFSKKIYFDMSTKYNFRRKSILIIKRNTIFAENLF